MTQEALKELQAARAEVERFAQMIRDEMSERAQRLQLWTNGQCTAWPDYERAVAELDRLRDKYGV